MLKLMEAAMAAGLSFTWDAKFGYLKFNHYHVHIVNGGYYELRNKSNELAGYDSDADGVVGWLVDYD